MGAEPFSAMSTDPDARALMTSAPGASLTKATLRPPSPSVLNASIRAFQGP